MPDTAASERGGEYDWREAERRRVRRTRRILIVSLVVLIILLLASFWGLIKAFQPVGKITAAQEAKGITWVRSIYGWGSAASEQFLGPQGATIGPDGTIWVTTQGQH